MRKLFSVVIVLAVIAAACGDGTGDAGDGGNGDDNPSISLVVNPWTASRLNAEVAKVIIEQELGNTVEITEIDENAMFTGMADGTLDAVLEIWPSGVTEDEQAFIDEGSVVNLGDLGAVGKIGWFVPSYVVEENPELATWEGFQDPGLASMFSTAETGDNGRFLGTDPSYSQYDEQIIDNLGLPLQVVFSGSEPATVAELDARVAANEPIVMYWWTPTAAVAAYDLVNVELPEYTAECGEHAAAGDGGVDCDYPEDVLFKAASGELEEKDSDVFAFLQAFTITTEDQLEMLPAVEIDGGEPADVAEQWVADHEDVWSKWLP